jgi:hypothetical protein
MLVRSDRLEALASPAFIAALALLVINDFALKPLFHNALTGKLSDFAGLFALTLFVATLWPQHRRLTASAIAVSFTFWKTSYADALIEVLNAMSPFAFGRTIDLTDLVALPMIPLAIWAAPRLTPWPLPRALRIGLAVLAPLAFTATSQPTALVRSTLDVSSAANVEEPALRVFFDDVAENHGLRCWVCDSLDDGRVYARPDEGYSRLGTLTVNFDQERRQLFYSIDASGERGREAVLALSTDIRAGMQQRFSGVVAIEFLEDFGFASLSEISTLFTVNVSADSEQPVETAAEATRTFSTTVEEVARTHGLRADEAASIYYLGRRFGSHVYERDLVVIPVLVSNTVLRVRVARQTANYAALYEAIIEDLALRLVAAFGSSAVAREETQEY